MLTKKGQNLAFLLNRAKFRVESIIRQNAIAAIAVAAVIAIIATYTVIVNNQDHPENNSLLLKLLVISDVVLLCALAYLIARSIIKAINERRRVVSGFRLQTRIVIMFSMVAMVPLVIMLVASVVFFNYGIHSWFSNKVSAVIDGSVDIARSYLEENKNIINVDVISMARDINRDSFNLMRDPRSFSQKLSFLAAIRKLPEALIFQVNDYGLKKVIAATKLSLSLQIDLESIGDELIKRAEAGDVVIVTSENDDRVIAFIRLDNLFDTYLMVGRFVDNKIINYIEATEGAALDYKNLKDNIAVLQLKFLIIFITVAIFLLLITAWVGFTFALYLIKPISALISATDKLKQGDLTARVKPGHENDEMAVLARAFNKMAEQLDRQRKELIIIQRRAAWSDVARRIAHEIKNPLTPIQLATQRLIRKYQNNVDDPETFARYLNIISRNVDNIGSMVDEFANFARIPAPVFSKNNLCELLEEVAFAREGIVKNIKFMRKIPKTPIYINCDSGQINQVLINVIKNAEESIAEKQIEDKTLNKNFSGIINIKIAKVGNLCMIAIKDNGKGFSAEIKERITEPYVTTKSKGTGLGLAIVKKIVEDHLGTIEFKNVGAGACVYLSFPIQQ